MKIADARRQREGMTLVELLIVITLLVMLMAAALPLMRPLLDDRKVRETSRQLNVFFANAKARALLSGRPVGVWIERSTLDPRQASRLYIAEVPPPYAGDLLGATASLEDENGDGLADSALLDSTYSFSAAPPTGFTSLPAATQAPWAFVRPGDFIRFDYRGTYYKIQQIVSVPPNIRVRFIDPAATWSPGPDGGWGVAGADDDFSGLPPDDIGERGWFNSDDTLLYTVSKPRPGVTVPYQIQRSPVKSISRPLNLPNGIVLDLGNSGVGTLGRQFGPRSVAPNPPDLSPILIVFNAEGSVENVILHDKASTPTQSIHFLVGRTEKMFQDSPNSPLRASAADATPIIFNRNLSDQANQWFSIGHRTGVLTATENAWQLESDNPTAFSGPTLAGSLQRSREFAAELQTPIGGR